MLLQSLLSISVVLSALILVYDEASLNFYGLLIAVPAVISIILFLLILWGSRSQSPATYTTLSTQKKDSTPPISPPTQISHNVDDTIFPLSLDFVCNNFSPLDLPLLKNMPLLKNTPQFRVLPPRRSDPQKKIAKASEQWEKEGKLNQAVEVAKVLLCEDIPAWKQLQDSLRSSQQQTLQQIQPQLQHRAVSATIAALRESRKRVKYCSEALTCYTVLLSIPPSDVLLLAITHYCRGFTYALLSLDSLSTVTELLDEAGRDCFNAFTLISDIYSETLRDFLVITYIAYGDVCIAAARDRARAAGETIEEKKEALAFWKQAALDSYRNALGHVSDQQLQQAIDIRVIQANQLGG